MHTQQSERVRFAESQAACRDVYPDRKKVATTYRPGDRVSMLAGTILSVRSGYARIQWPTGYISYELLDGIEARP